MFNFTSTFSNILNAITARNTKKIAENTSATKEPVYHSSLPNAPAPLTQAEIRLQNELWEKKYGKEARQRFMAELASKEAKK